LAEKSALAATRAAQAITRQFELLVTEPELGRSLGEIPELRELLIPFGDSGYVALYRYEPDEIMLFMYSLFDIRKKQVTNPNISSVCNIFQNCIDREILKQDQQFLTHLISLSLRTYWVLSSLKKKSLR